MSQRASHRLRRVVSGVVVLAIAGCGIFSPYEHAPMLETPPIEGLQLAGDAEAAMAWAEQFRGKYYHNLNSAAGFRNVTGALLIGLSGWAVYNGLKPTDGDGPTTADVRRGTRLGAAAASVYALRQFLVNPGQEAIFAEGYRAMTCLMLQAAPLLVTEASDRAKVAPFAWPTATPGSLVAPYAQPAASDKGVPLPFSASPPGELDRFRIALDRLEAKIQYVNVELAEVRGRASAMLEVRDELKNPKSTISRQIASTQRALLYARNAVNDGRLLLRTYESAGREIRGRAAIVVAAVNEQAQAKQADLSGVTDLLKNAQDITGSVLNIGGSTAADQVDLTTSPSEDVSALLLQDGPPAPGVMVNVAGSVAIAYLAAQASTASTRQSLAAQQVAQTAAQTSAASTPYVPSVPATPSTPRASDPPAPAASTGSASQPTKSKEVKKLATPKPVAKAAPPVTTQELSKLREQLDGLIKQATTNEADAQKKKDEQQRAKDQSDWNARLDKLKAQSEERHLRCAEQPKSGGCITHLAKETENLYAARRPVVHEVLAFRAKTRAVALTPECVELAVLRVAPNDVIRAHPGDTVSFIVTQRASGAPLAVMQGSPDPKSGATFNFLAQQGTSHYVAKIDLGKDMPKQTLKLVVSDSKGVVTQNLSVVVGDPLPPQRVDLATAAKSATAAAVAAQTAADGAAAAAKSVAKAASDAQAAEAGTK